MATAQAQRKRSRRFISFVAVLLLLMTFGGAALRLQADAWWYTLDANAPTVFYTPLKARVLLFCIGAAVAFVALFFNGKKALSSNMVFESDPLFADLLPAFRALHTLIKRLLLPVSIALAILLGLGAASMWEAWLLNANAVPFEKKDPIFGLDYGWFVFELGLRQAIVSWLLTLTIVVGIGVAAIYFVMPLMAQVARMPVRIPRIQAHLSVVAGVFLILAGSMVWYGRFDAGTVISSRFTGAGYTDLQVLGATALITYLLVLGGIATLALRRYFAAGATVAVVALTYIGGVLVWPFIVQSYQVAPNELTVQTPYIRHALNATRFAYGLDDIEYVDFNVQEQPTEQAMAEAKTTLDSMRLWDPDILRLTIDNLQSLRNYFGFQDVDVDRYRIDGRQRLMMLGPRNLIQDRLDESRRSWQNLRLQYTHGNGLVAVPVNQATPSGQPVFMLSDIPPRGRPELKVDQPRLYYSDTRSMYGEESDSYVLVRSALPEFDYSIEGDGEHRWEGNGGIPIAGFWRKFVYSMHFMDKDLYFTDAITSETRLLYRRSVRERARHIMPFLKWDNDPYITIVDGRLVWILDGYTMTDAIPYSAMSQVGSTRLNYMRNSVKMTIDAYTGEWNAYVVDSEDPILRAYARIYPGLLKDRSAAPEAVVEHFRYPEDLFLLQAFQLTLYHRLDENPDAEAQKFFRYEDAWQVPEMAGQRGGTEIMSPYYVVMRLPNEQRDAFMLILPFNPRERPNMIGWMAAHCDPEEYGRLQLFQFPRDKNINGPAQQEASFQTDLELTKQVTLIGQVGSEVMHGNLLVVPVGQSVVYVKTLFLVSRQTGLRPLPELKLVVLAYSNRIVFAETYDRALALLRGKRATQPNEPEPVGPEGVLDGEAARRGLELFEQGRQAMADGDWAKYGEAMKKLEALLERAARAQDEGSGPSQ